MTDPVSAELRAVSSAMSAMKCHPQVSKLHWKATKNIASTKLIQTSWLHRSRSRGPQCTYVFMSLLITCHPLAAFCICSTPKCTWDVVWAQWMTSDSDSNLEEWWAWTYQWNVLWKMHTLQETEETNISHLGKRKIIDSKKYLLEGDLSVPRRVFQCVLHDFWHRSFWN